MNKVEDFVEGFFPLPSVDQSPLDLCDDLMELNIKPALEYPKKKSVIIYLDTCH